VEQLEDVTYRRDSDVGVITWSKQPLNTYDGRTRGGSRSAGSAPLPTTRRSSRSWPRASTSVRALTSPGEDDSASQGCRRTSHGTSWSSFGDCPSRRSPQCRVDAVAASDSCSPATSSSGPRTHSSATPPHRWASAAYRARTHLVLRAAAGQGDAVFGHAAAREASLRDGDRQSPLLFDRGAAVPDAGVCPAARRGRSPRPPQAKAGIEHHHNIQGMGYVANRFAELMDEFPAMDLRPPGR